MAQSLGDNSYTSLALDLSADPSPTLADSSFFSLKCTPLSILSVTILVNASPQITAVVSMARRPQYFASLPNSPTSITFLLYCHRHLWPIFSSFPTLNTWAHILVHVDLPRAVSHTSFTSLWPASSGPQCRRLISLLCLSPSLLLPSPPCWAQHSHLRPYGRHKDTVK